MARVTAFVALVIGCLGVSVAGAQVLTFARDDYGSDAGTRAIASADFNRDGWLDVAQASLTTNSVTILLSRGGSSLVRAFEIPVGLGPFDLTTGDFNRDGIPDLAVANADSHTISILLGRGDGSFTRADIAAPLQNPRGITTADVNNDGRPDLIYTGYPTAPCRCCSGTVRSGSRKARPSRWRVRSRKVSPRATSITTAISISRWPATVGSRKSVPAVAAGRSPCGRSQVTRT